jgi:NADPH:quinone reductase-like Zn-dependent oxidoreductase
MSLGEDSFAEYTIASTTTIAKRGSLDEMTAAAAPLAGLFESGALKPPAIKKFSLDQAGEAIAEVAGGHARGKMVVIP